MSSSKQLLGAIVFSLTVVGFLASFQAVNDAFPPKRSQSVARSNPLPSPLTDRMQTIDRAGMSEHSGKQRADNEPHRFAICNTLDGKAFAWFWPNVPFAAMTCSNQRSN